MLSTDGQSFHKNKITGSKPFLRPKVDESDLTAFSKVRRGLEFLITFCKYFKLIYKYLVIM